MFKVILSISLLLSSLATLAESQMNDPQLSKNTKKYHRLLSARIDFDYNQLKAELVEETAPEMKKLKDVSRIRLDELFDFAQTYELPYHYKVDSKFWRLTGIRNHFIYTYSISVIHNEKGKTAEEQCTAILSPLTNHLTFCTPYTTNL